MARQRINPPEKLDWFARLRDLSVTCFVCFEDEQEVPLRRMWHLLCDAPDFQWTFGLVVPEEGYFECMLAAGYYESAARSFFTSESGLMLARDGSGHYLATVVLPSGHQAEASADSPALALIGALASALAEDWSLLSELVTAPIPLPQAA